MRNRTDAAARVDVCEMIDLDESRRRALATGVPSFAQAERKLGAQQAVASLVRPAVTASRPMTAVTSMRVGARRTPVICGGVLPPQITAR